MDWSRRRGDSTELYNITYTDVIKRVTRIGMEEDIGRS